MKCHGAVLAFLIALGGCQSGNLDVIARVSSSVSDAGNNVTTDADGGSSLGLEDLQRAYAELRFGMLLHFGILTYTGNWGDGNLPIQQFNPTKLDTTQWAAAAVAAKMKYAILSVRHIDGFALWNTATNNVSVGAISWRKGQGDVVREFVDAFRARGLKVGFLYSMWDATQGLGSNLVGNTPITRAQIDYLKAQLTELLSNYGPISYLLFTSWAWQMGHNAVPYQEDPGAGEVAAAGVSGFRSDPADESVGRGRRTFR